MRSGLLIFLVAGCALAHGGAAAGSTGATDTDPPPVITRASDLRDLGWVWPARHFQLSHPFVQPAHAYGPGHRGIDLDLLGGSTVFAPADGVIAFTGVVAGRGVVTIEHPHGLVTTLEPVDTALTHGIPVHGGDEIGLLAHGGHSAPGSLHFGVRLRGEYINPLLLLGAPPRAILLPCCE